MEPIYTVIKEVPIDKIPDIWNLVVSGHYTNLFFDKWTPYVGLAIKNNFSLLLLFAVVFQKFSKLTKNTWDDKVSNWFVNFLSKRNKPKTTIKGK